MIESFLKRASPGLALRFGLLGPWTATQDPRRLCARLRLEGFEHLVAADEAPEPLRLRIVAEGPWPVALWAVAYYRGPVAVRLGPGVAPGLVAGLGAVGVVRAQGANDGEADGGEAPRLALVDDASEAEIANEDASARSSLVARASLEPGGRIRLRFEPEMSDRESP